MKYMHPFFAGSLARERSAPLLSGEYSRSSGAMVFLGPSPLPASQCGTAHWLPLKRHRAFFSAGISGSFFLYDSKNKPRAPSPEILFIKIALPRKTDFYRRSPGLPKGFCRRPPACGNGDDRRDEVPLKIHAPLERDDRGLFRLYQKC